MPGRKPDDPTLKAAFRVILRQGTPLEQVEAKLAECRGYVKGNPALTAQLRNAALLGEYLIEESAAGRLKVLYGSPHVLDKLKALLTDLGRTMPSDPNAAPSRPEGRANGSAVPGKAAIMARFDNLKDFLHRDIPYGKTHPEIQKLDAYLVKSSQPAPVAIEFHGGGWRRGSKSEFTDPGNLIADILAAGISVVSIRDPHSAWHSVLLAEALVKAGGTAVSRIGPEVGKDPEADVAAILSFLREQLLSRPLRP